MIFTAETRLQLQEAMRRMHEVQKNCAHSFNPTIARAFPGWIGCQGLLALWCHRASAQLLCGDDGRRAQRRAYCSGEVLWLR